MEVKSVEDLLKQKGVYFQYSGHDLVVKCLNIEHEDNNPSMRIDKTTGIFNCFSCGYKGNIFKYFGILTDLSFIKVAKIKEKIANLRTNIAGLEIPPVAIPYNKSFRGISASTLLEFNAFYLPGPSDKLTDFEDRIIFPITDITGKVRSFHGRHILSSSGPKYKNYPSGTPLQMFPPTIPTGYTSLVIVEGIMDMLNCYDKGLKNIVCTFGVTTLLKDTNSKLMAYKAQGITKIFLMYDNDEAGIKAMQSLVPLIEAVGFMCEILYLPEDTDPGDLREEYIKSIGDYVNNENMYSGQMS